MGRGDAFEVRPDAAQFRGQECIDKVQTSIEPREEVIFDFIVHGKRNLRAVRPDFAEIDQPHQIDVAANRFKRALVGRIIVEREQNGARFEPEWAAKAEIDCLR